MFARVAVPEMMRFGYKPRFAVGVVAGSSVLGMLIPPSVMLIIYAMTTVWPVRLVLVIGSLTVVIVFLSLAWIHIQALRSPPTDETT